MVHLLLMEGWLHLLGKMSNLKESHPIQINEFVIQIGVALEPGFNWWVFHVLKKQDAITLLVKCCNIKYLKKTHKFGLPLPKSVDDALAIGRCTGSTLWAFGRFHCQGNDKCQSYIQ